MTTSAGCETVAGAGATGISVDAQARPMVVFTLCNDHIDGATIYRDRLTTDPKGEDSSVPVADWNAISPITPGNAMKASLSTAEPSQSWSRVGAVEALRPGVRYVVYGWTRDNTWSTAAVEFTLERLSRLKPGQVLTQTYVQATGKDVDTVQSYRQFESSTCAVTS
ncbi:hypothetical protein [Humibacillus sp. DSM 29435]|uniref:hypothetical protein n=1 Tax=Humibacillus sp. DSM 29435 TaxID=1869167 RepID=UPI0011130C7D|nr:hypothetical protein [Humibacillus sp. DSM 29435]